MRYDQEPEEPATHLDGIPFLQGMENTLRAVRALVGYAEFQRTREGAPAADAQGTDVADAARAIVEESNGKPLVERQAKRLLRLYGIPTTREILARSADEAGDAADEIGYPVVLKIESSDILHKTEAGGVMLNVRDRAEACAGFSAVLSHAASYDATADIAGVLVQEMAPSGREMIVGMTQDPAYGPAIAVGLGGIFVEVLRDVALGVPPLSARDCESMLGRLRGSAVLDGVRGAPPADRQAIVDILQRFSTLCHDVQDMVAEIDMNPLLVFERGCGATVVDCLIVPKVVAAH